MAAFESAAWPPADHLPRGSSPVDYGAAARAEFRAESRVRRAAAYPEADPRLAPLVADLERRLRPALRAAGVAFAPADFAALVLDMARVALQWSLEEARHRTVTPAGGAPAVAPPPSAPPPAGTE